LILKNTISGEEIFRRWQAGEKERELADRLNISYSALRGRRRRWRDENPKRAREIELELGPREDEWRGKQKEEEGSFAVNGNRAIGTLTSRRIISDKDLIVALGVDLSIWKYDKFEANKWEVGAKQTHADLTYVDGRVSGTLKKDGLKVEQLFQVKVPFVRRKLEAIEWPAIQAATIKLGTLRTVKRPARAFERCLLFGDSQMGYSRNHNTGKLDPFHDRAALDIVEQIAADLQPDSIHDLGDGSDLAEWTSKFIRSPEMHFTTQAMIYERAWWYGGLRRVAPNARIMVHEGNHDARMPKALAANMIAACGLKAADMRDDYPVMSIPFLLGLKRMDIEWLGGYPDDVSWLNDGLCCYHGDIVRQKGGDTTRILLRDAKHSQIVGHIHRTEMAFAARTDHANGKRVIVRTLSPGCTCRNDGIVPAVKKRVNWQQGLMIVDYDPAGEAFCPTFVAIENGQAMYNGRIYEARDRVEQLRDETEYAF